MLDSDFQNEHMQKAIGMLKAMAHPIRLSIVHALKDGNKLSVTQIHELLDIEQSTTSHHLSILKEKGVLCSKRNGKNTYYFVQNMVLGQIIDCVKTCSCNEND